MLNMVVFKPTWDLPHHCQNLSVKFRVKFSESFDTYKYEHISNLTSIHIIYTHTCDKPKFSELEEVPDLEWLVNVEGFWVLVK